MTMRISLAILVVLGLVLAAATALIFQDKIAQFNIKPRTPYQIYTPPPAPAYGARGAWALWPHDAESGEADIFYIHSNTYYSRNHWNAPLAAKSAERALKRAAAPNEAGPFLGVGAVYGPRYRQATLFASFTHKYDGLAARELAYRDVADAFDAFLAQRASTDRPIVLAGYGQGALHAMGLLQHRFANDEELRALLAAAYLIGAPVPTALFEGALAAIPPCAAPQDIRCVIAYTDFEQHFDGEHRRHRQRALVWNDNKRLESRPASPHLCVNPLSWRADEQPADPEAHLGAASATGLRFGETPPAISKAIGAVCDNGILTVDTPQQDFLRRKRWFGAQWRAQDYNLFYHDLAADAMRRVRTLQAVRDEEARFLKPISETVDLPVSPINKAPSE